ncbi:hypothetical protein TNCV_1201251 [Trichonephila clavipes]|nr:hypothetical protein TNCV_1201251 [Trichonephila clavipes]
MYVSTDIKQTKRYCHPPSHDFLMMPTKNASFPKSYDDDREILAIDYDVKTRLEQEGYDVMVMTPSALLSLYAAIVSITVPKL